MLHVLTCLRSVPGPATSTTSHISSSKTQSNMCVCQLANRFSHSYDISAICEHVFQQTHTC